MYAPVVVVRGDGIDLTIRVEDELDAEIVRLVLAAADRRAKRNAKRADKAKGE